MRGCLCLLFSVFLITIFPIQSRAQLSASFSASTTSGCSPIVVNFTDMSTGSPTSWSWNLGNGTTSTLQNPSTTYTTSGTYTVTLTVSNGTTSSTKTITNYITVLASPAVAFTASDSTSICPPKTITFTNSSVPGVSGTTSYTWDFGDGTSATSTSPSHTYTAAGSYNVTLVVTNSSGCTKSLVKSSYIHVNSKPTAGFSASNTTGCSTPLTINFTNSSTGASTYSWSFGDGTTSTATSPSHTYTSAGTYTVRLIATNSNGCSDTLTRSSYITINSLHASFTTTTSTCVGTSITFTNTSTGGITSSRWSFGDGSTATSTSPTYAYLTAGTYTVRLIVSNGTCADTTTTNVVVHPKPTIAFSADTPSSCKTPQIVNFTNSTTGATSYLWRFGDGSTSTTTNPSHTYSSYTNYTVKLIATTSYGCTDSLTKTNYISIQPLTSTITASPSSGCAPLTVHFSSSLTASLSSYSWRFGDGSTSSSSTTPSHTYTTAGTYTVVFKYTTTTGCTDSATTTVTASNKPTASFSSTASPICASKTISFTNTSTGATTYTWYFGDGNMGSDTNPTHIYSYPDTFTVTLIAKNGGCSDTITKTNLVKVIGPGVNFTPNYDCGNRLTIDFQNTTVGGTTWSWSFGDGSTSTSKSPSHTYSSYGTDTVRLIASDTTTCKDTLKEVVSTYPMSSGFSANDTVICKKSSVLFKGPANTHNYTYNWIYSDGTSQNTGGVDSASKVFWGSGVYTVKLVVADGRGCYDTTTKSNYIHVGGPNVAFSANPLNGCPMTSISFHDSTTDGLTITGRMWSFGDGGTLGGNNASPSHTYTSVGTYTVKIVVTDSNGCKDSLTKNNYINIGKPTASFTVTDTTICPGYSDSFINSSTGATSYLWDFGDGSTSTTARPRHSYSTAGTYTIKLIATNASGCTDTLKRTAYIHVNRLNIGFTMSDSFASCPPLTITMTNTSSGISTYAWTFGNGNGSILTNPTTVYTYPGVYTVKLRGTAANGCMDSVSKTVTVNGPRGTLTYSPTNGCSPVTINFTSLDTNTTSITWDMNNGYTHTASTSSSTTCTSTYSYTFTTPGKYVPVVVLSEGSSCNVYVKGVDTIKVDKVTANFTFAPDSFCGSGIVNFTDTVLSSLTAVTSRSWSFGDGATTTGHNPSHTYTSTGSFIVKLIVTAASGCQDTITKTVVIFPKPNVSAGPDKKMCYGGSAVTLSASGAHTYSWAPGTGLSCTSCTSPTANPGVTTTYVVTGTDSIGCTNTDTVVVKVNPLPTVNAGPDKTICAGSSASIAATGASSYTWTPTTGLSCSSCSSPTASPTGTTSYSVSGTDTNGCVNTDTVIVKVNALPNVNAGADKAICKGDSVLLSVTGASNYSWTPTTGLSCTTCANPTAKPTSTTTYVVTGTDTSSCVNKDTVTVTVNPLPVVSAGADKSICAGSSDTLHATGADTYVWSPGTGLSCTTCTNPVVTPTSAGTYTVTGTDANGCKNTDTVHVTLNPLPAVNAGPDQSVCKGGTVTLGATGAAMYAWSPATGLSCSTCASPTATVLATTTYYVTGTDINGCKKTDTVVVSLKPSPTVDAGPDQSICKGASVHLTATGANTYNWSPGASLSCASCDTTTASPTNTTTYTVIGTGTDGCTDTDQVMVTVHQPPVIIVTHDTTICDGSSIQLNASGAANYTWSPGSGLSCTNCPSPVAEPATKTTYTVIGTDGNGCIDSNKVTLSIIQRSPTSVGPGDTLCQGQSAQLSANGGTSYQWLPSSGLDNSSSSTPTATPDSTIQYMVIIKQGDCFADTGYVNVFVYPKPTVSISGNRTILAGNNTQLYANGTNILTYEWSPATGLSCIECPGPIATPNQKTTYTVLVTGAGGCTDSADITIDVRCDNSQVFIPNTFTPNGDGINDRFYPSGKGIGTIKRFSIYNRWGELLYEVDNMPINDPTYGWDGTYKGQPVKPDVFVYIIDATCESGEPMQLKGDISIVR